MVEAYRRSLERQAAPVHASSDGRAAALANLAAGLTEPALQREGGPGLHRLTATEASMTAIAQTVLAKAPRRRRRPLLQPLFAASAAAMLAPIAVALAVTLARGRPLPWQFHMLWVSPHIAIVMLALGLGTVQLALPKGDRRHRLLGYGWLAVMALLSVTGLMIQLEPGHVTLVHRISSGFAVANLVLTPGIIWSARTGRGKLHRGLTLGLFGNMLFSGLMAFIPFRAIGLLVFGMFH
jgi:uncharacterized membrane protein